MKNLIFLLISFICLANAQQKSDSIETLKLAKVLDQKNEKNRKDMQEVRAINKENESLLELVFLKFKRLISKSEAKKLNHGLTNNKEGTKSDNRNDPVTEIEVPAGIDTIRGGWIYRLFHQNNFYYKPYKIENNEKVYLD